jgi:hypothetical protein
VGGPPFGILTSPDVPLAGTAAGPFCVVETGDVTRAFSLFTFLTARLPASMPSMSPCRLS